ncbi:hypothetical protein [Natronoglomus mannanivorans]|uniref:Uncharacterized protein n=1 Tax=Natronoglomus mannanivorans TaxID=2979990 RepID=A0AAP3E390_9EURY|nr:hypothetical protein [Halobacteria archaeon AArc-xg1-1]
MYTDTHQDRKRTASRTHRVENDVTDLEWTARRLTVLRGLDDDPRAVNLETLIRTHSGETGLEISDPAREDAWIRALNTAEARL